MAARRFIPSQHPRDRFGRFTRSRSAQASPAEKRRAGEVAAGLKPKRGATGLKARTYLAGIAPPQHRTAVSAYTGGGYVAVHKALRAGKAGDPGVAAMDAAMLPLPDDLVVSRRVPAAQFGSVDVNTLTGLKVKDAAYAPTSIGAVRPTKGDVRLRIAVPKGTRAAVDPDTGEVILDRDLEMVVAGVATNPAGSTDVFLTVLPKTETAGPTVGLTGDAGQVRADLMRRRVPELQAMMRERGLKPGRMRKSQLVDALVADEVGSDAGEGPGLAAPYPERVAAAATGQTALDTPTLGVSRRPRPAEFDEALRNINFYTGPEYAAINNHLRGQPLPYGYTTDDVEPTITAIDEAMAASRLKSDIAVWRGVIDAGAMFGDRMSADLTGLTWREDAYVSTTAKDLIARRFSRTGPSPLMMRILAPAGTPAVEASGMDLEAEVLLGRGQQMRVVADHGPDARGMRRIDVEVISSG